MGLTRARRIQQSFIPRRRTQWFIEKDEAQVIRTVGSLPGDDTPREEDVDWRIVGYGDDEYLEEAGE
jgi:hypothetical protein